MAFAECQAPDRVRVALLSLGGAFFLPSQAAERMLELHRAYLDAPPPDAPEIDSVEGTVGVAARGTESAGAGVPDERIEDAAAGRG